MSTSRKRLADEVIAMLERGSPREAVRAVIEGWPVDDSLTEKRRIYDRDYKRRRRLEERLSTGRSST
jgi:hypothetical protein